MQIEVVNLIDSLFKEVNPIPIKEALNILGFNVGLPRLPLVKCSEELRKVLQIQIKDLVK